MVYTDGVHLIADSIVELHEFAAQLGLHREWFQDHRHPHYDLTTGRMQGKAITHGAILMSRRNLIIISKVRRNI